MQATIKRRKFGTMKCEKCGGKTELFGNLDTGWLKYCCLDCHEIFFSDILYVKSLIK